MPTKSKSPRKGQPPKPIPQSNGQGTVTCTSSTSKLLSNYPAQTASGLDPETENQFELELCWCIQQLETGLANSKLKEKEAFSINKSLNVLKSNNASLIRKRQVMRNTFGDYRLKMAEEEKKFGKAATSVKFTTPKRTERKAQFIKKASCKGMINITSKSEANGEKNKDNDCLEESAILSKAPFKFNFALEET